MIVEHLVGALAALRLLDADRVVLGVVPADACAQDDPVVAEELEGRELLGEDDRVAQRHDQDRRAEPDALRRAGGDRERRQGFEPVDRVEPLADQQVIGDEQRVEPELLHGAGELLDPARPLRAVAVPDVRRQEDPEPSDFSHVPDPSVIVRWVQRPR